MVRVRVRIAIGIRNELSRIGDRTDLKGRQFDLIRLRISDGLYWTGAIRAEIERAIWTRTSLRVGRPTRGRTLDGFLPVLGIFRTTLIDRIEFDEWV